MFHVELDTGDTVTVGGVKITLSQKIGQNTKLELEELPAQLKVGNSTITVSKKSGRKARLEIQSPEGTDISVVRDNRTRSSLGAVEVK